MNFRWKCSHKIHAKIAFTCISGAKIAHEINVYGFDVILFYEYDMICIFSGQTIFSQYNLSVKNFMWNSCVLDLTWLFQVNQGKAVECQIHFTIVCDNIYNIHLFYRRIHPVYIKPIAYEVWAKYYIVKDSSYPWFISGFLLPLVFITGFLLPLIYYRIPLALDWLQDSSFPWFIYSVLDIQNRLN